MVDTDNIRGAIEQLPDQLREGGRIGIEAGEQLALPAAVVLAGMGGSALGGELFRGVIAGQCPVPVTRVRGFGVPSYAGPGTLVVCVSYSGDTAETLACARQAHAQGASVLAIGSGGTLGDLAAEWGEPFARVPSGLRPRAALGYLFGAISAALGVAGLASEGLAEEAAQGAELADVAAAEEMGRDAGVHHPAHLRRGAACDRRLPLEDAVQREREDARVQPRVPRGGAQRDRGLGGSRCRQVRGGVPARRPPAPGQPGDAGRGAGDDRRRRGGDPLGAGAGRHVARAGVLADRPGRLGELLRGARARGRSWPDRAHHRAQEPHGLKP